VTNCRSSRRVDAPKRAPKSDLALAALGAHQQQACDVDAGNQEEKTGAAKEHQDDGMNVANNHVGQSFHVRPLTVVRVGILRFQLLRDRRHVGSGHLQGDAIFETREAEEPVAAATVALVVLRSPEFGGLGGGEVEVSGQHSDDGVRIPVEHHGLADHIRALAVTRLPGGVTEDHGARGGGLVFPGSKVAPQDGSDPQRAKESGTHARPRRQLRSRGRGQHESV
jgi:hypothetical protein